MHPIPNLTELELFHGVTFSHLVELEPRLQQLLWAARQAGAACRSQAQVDRAFAPIRGCLADLVGFASRHNRPGLLGGVGAYEVAYWKLYSAAADLLVTPVAEAAGQDRAVAPEVRAAAPARVQGWLRGLWARLAPGT
jgi:hypothetical protein